MLRFAATVALICVSVLYLGRKLVDHVPSNVTTYVRGLFGSSRTCYRTIDMPRLTSRMVADLLARTNGKTADEASPIYKSRLHELDETISAVADQCVLLRREAVVSAPADIDVTAQIASRLGIDLNGTQSPTSAQSVPIGATGASDPASGAAAPGAMTGTDGHAASDSAGNPKLDE